MLPVLDNDIVVEGDLGGEVIDMGMDENALNELMGLLINLYTNRRLALVREYSCNALDAQIENGYKGPILVGLPKTMKPYLTIRDFGVGLSLDDIKNVYSKYGASTKRNTNEQVGSFGVGSKSAFTYTNQFIVTSIKDGYRIKVVVSRTDAGAGKMEVVDRRETNESSGTEVSIPVKRDDIDAFKTVTDNFFRFWAPGTVLVDGKEPERISAQTVVCENKSVTANNVTFPVSINVVQSLDQDYVVMGNVAYPAGTSLYNEGTYRTFRIVATVPIGAVAIAPSREGLKDSPGTVEVLKALREAFSDGVGEAITKDIASAATHGDAIKRYLSWPANLVNAAKGVEYRGEKIPKTFKGDFLIFEPWRRRNQSTSYNEVSLRELSELIFVTGLRPSSLTPRQKAKVAGWAEENDIDNNMRYAFVQELDDEDWLADTLQVEWDEIKATDIDGPRVPGQKRTGARYKVYNHTNSRFEEVTTLDTTKPIVYYSPKEGITDYGPYVRDYVNLVGDVSVVLLGRNRWAKFLRDFPKAIHIQQYAKPFVIAALSGLTDDDKLALSLNSDDKDKCKLFADAKIDDPAIQDFLALVESSKTANSPTIVAHTQAATIANRFHIYHGVQDWKVGYKKPVGPFAKYPLLNNIYSYSNAKQKAHAALYVNAVYAAEKES